MSRLEVRVAGLSLAGLVEKLVGAWMGGLHAYYAVEAVRSGVARVAALYAEGEPVGVEVFYRVRVGEVDACVHYYVVVAGHARGRGYGRVLVASVEEACGASLYLATVSSSNTASRRLFESMDYRGYTWWEVEERMGWRIAHNLLRATCGYEDDMVYSKPGLELYGEKLGVDGVSEGVWRRVCWEPWARLAGLG